MWAISTRRGRAHHSGRIVVLLSIAAPIVVLEVLGRLHIAGDKAASASSRLLIWKFAAREFERTPILGQGFGGWQRTFPAYADGRDLLATFPPHNSLIYMWSQAGLIAAASGIAVLVWIGRALRRSYRADPASRPLVAATGVALTWLFLHSFFENYGLLGDEHMQPILALAVAMCLATARHLGVTETPMDGSHGTQSHRVPEPAVSAV
jgi:O-antigen ligase